MAEWNLCRFAEALLPLLHENRDEAIKIGQNAISNFYDIYYFFNQAFMERNFKKRP